MVTGIERWKEYFNDYKDKYVLIGGAACNLLEEELDIKKDVFRLIAMLPQDSRFSLPDKLRNDMNDFYQRIGELPNPDFFKNAGLRGLDAQRLLDLFNTAFL